MSRGRGSLSLRLAALGLGQVFLIALAAVAIAVLGRPTPPGEDVHDLARSAAERVESALGTPALRDRLVASSAELRLELTVRDADGSVLASSLEPPLVAPPRRPPPRPGALRLGDGPPPPPGPFGGPPHAPRRVIPIPLEGGAVLLARGIEPTPPHVVALLTLLAGMLVIGAGGWLTGRWIVRPLEALARTARAVGEGDLRARSHLARGDEIGELARSLDEMAERVERLVRAERELLANVSHELRTPLARIRVAMELAAEGDADAARLAVTEIATDLSELEAIVDDILVAMRFDVVGAESARAGLPMSSFVEVSAAEVAARALERFRARHPGRPLESSLASDAPPVMVDPVLFRRVIDNLLENAHKYSPDPGAPISLVVRASSPTRVVFEVIDRGVGISAADLPRVFTPFFRAERSRDRGAGGVGLGLTLVQRIVEAHGGAVELESTPGQGTVARVVLEARAR